MSDYDDGCWHGWNGGECPVHPETASYELSDIIHVREVIEE